MTKTIFFFFNSSAYFGNEFEDRRSHVSLLLGRGWNTMKMSYLKNWVDKSNWLLQFHRISRQGKYSYSKIKRYLRQVSPPCFNESKLWVGDTKEEIPLAKE